MSTGHFVLQCFDTRLVGLCLTKACDTYIAPQAAYCI